MINVPLLIKIYLGRIHKFFKRQNTEKNVSTISRFRKHTRRLVWLSSLPLYSLNRRDPCGGSSTPQKKAGQSKTVCLTYRWHLIKYSYTITVVINNCWHKNISEFSEYEEVISKYGASKCKKPSLPLPKIKYTSSLAFYQSKAIYIVDKEKWQTLRPESLDSYFSSTTNFLRDLSKTISLCLSLLLLIEKIKVCLTHNVVVIKLIRV